MRRTPSAEARLTAGEFRLGDRSKRWESRPPCSSARAPCQIRGGGGMGATRSAHARQAYCDVKRLRGQLPVERDRGVEAGPSFQESQRRRREDTQTCNAFEASAPLTPGQGSGASVGSLRRKMRRRLGQLGLVVRASGERVQIAVLLGVAKLAGQGPIHQIIGPVNPSYSSNPSTNTPAMSARPSPSSLFDGLPLPVQLLIDHAPPGVTSTNPSFDPSGLGRARRKTSIIIPSLSAALCPVARHAALLQAPPITAHPSSTLWLRGCSLGSTTDTWSPNRVTESRASTTSTTIWTSKLALAA